MTVPQTVKAEGYTTEDLLATLANGVAVDLADGSRFEIADEKVRQVLAFFLLDPLGKAWLRTPVSKGNSDQGKLIDWLMKPSLPPLPTPPANNTDKVRWRLVAVKAKQLGGLQPFCLEDGSDAPEVPVFISRPIFMAQGPNGAGKSSLVRAVTFLLTGQVFGTHDFQPFNHMDQINHCTFADGDTASLPTIVPMPTQKQWLARKAAGGDPVVTSVTGEFESTGDPEQTKRICRRIVAGKGGSFEAVLEVDGTRCDDGLADTLGISPLAVELSALHMARLAHLRLGQEDPLAEGVRSLTGLRAITDLAETTAPKVAGYLSGLYAKNLEKDAKNAAAQFTDEVEKLREAFDGADTPPPFPSAPSSASCRDDLQRLSDDLEKRAEKVRAAIADSAGVEPDDVDLEGLEDRLLAAHEALTIDSLQQGGVAKIVAAAEAWTAEDVKVLQTSLADAISRANDFAEAQEDALRIVRRRHYALVGKSLDAEGIALEIEDCPTCLRALSDDDRDPVLDLPVKIAIQRGAKERDDLELTIDRFVEALTKQIWDSIPDTIKLVAKDLDKVPDGAAWAASCSANALTSLSPYPALKKLCASAAEDLAAEAAKLPAPTEFEAPAELAPLLSGTRIEKGINLLQRLLSLRTWASSSAQERKRLFGSVYGIAHSGVAVPDGSLRGRISELRSFLKDDKPVGRRIYGSLVRFADAWQGATERADASREAGNALKQLSSLSTIVSVQVDGLFGHLNSEMLAYRDLFYEHPGYEGARASAVHHDGATLQVAAETEGARGSAHSIANSSQIRAHLFGFVLALLRRVWSQSGGLELVVMDDPQLLFDEKNQERLAQGLLKVLDDDFRLMIMTFDRIFADRVARAGDCRLGAALSDKVDRQMLVPRGNVYCSLSLKQATDDLMRKRTEWRDTPGDHDKIVALCQMSRQFIERTLVDFLGEAQAPVSDHPTLNPLVDRLRRLVGNRSSVVDDRPFAQLLALLPDGDPTKKTLQDGLNWSNHFNSDNLTLTHAKAVDAMLERFLDLREQCFDVLAGRVVMAAVPKAANSDEPVDPEVAAAPALHVQVAGRLAAGEALSGPAGEEDVPEGQLLSWEPELHQAFGLGGAAASLPYPLTPSSMLICDREAIKPRKGDFVVVRDCRTGQALPGWCRVEGESLLLAGMPGRHQASYPLASVEVFRISGALFEGGATDPRPCHPLNNSEALKGLCAAAEITEGESAEPLMRKDDYALLGQDIPPDEVFGAPTDALFAVQLGDDRWVVKRVGGAAGQRHRLLLPLGTAGSGEVITADQTAFGAVIKKAYPVVGFVRHR